jgi:hypothetical protein
LPSHALLQIWSVQPSVGACPLQMDRVNAEVLTMLQQLTRLAFGCACSGPCCAIDAIAQLPRLRELSLTYDLSPSYADADLEQLSALGSLTTLQLIGGLASGTVTF